MAEYATFRVTTVAPEESTDFLPIVRVEGELYTRSIDITPLGVAVHEKLEDVDNAQGRCIFFVPSSNLAWVATFYTSEINRSAL